MGKYLKLCVLALVCSMAFGCAQKGSYKSDPYSTQAEQRFRRSYEAAFDNNEQQGNQQLLRKARSAIGTPYVPGGMSPGGFDCSGFVCWVFRQSGVYDTGRLGAKGLYSLCTDVSRDEARPGDLVFFTKTMGADVKGITHVGIYVGNNMMLHAGDPVGFADLQSDKWAKKIYAFGRLPVQQGAQADE